MMSPFFSGFSGRLPLLLAINALLPPAMTAAPAPAAPFELREGDRVVFVGDTFIEREQTYGYVEMALTTRFPDRNVTFRNLGWSGDTVLGTSRAGFDPPEAGFERLQEELKLVQPSVVFLGYGMAASFAGEAGLAQFEKDLDKLIETIKSIAGDKPVRFVFLSPIRHEKLDPPLPDPAAHNEQLGRYASVIERVANRARSPYIPLFSELRVRSGPGEEALTDNGIHLNAKGYARCAEAISKGLGWPMSAAPLPQEQSEQLRQTILKKNELFFHRWRPQNQTYLFGFRKYEQGQNAREIPMFDPLVEEQEKRIAELRRPGGRVASAGSTSEPRPGGRDAPATLKRTAAPAPSQPLPEFEVAPGFEVTLFAEDPQLAKPIQMNFDPAGRLWVASSSVYPQIEPGQKASDKVLILEDSDGDGKADKSTVFAEDLLIPTGIEPGDGGVYVGQSTELLHFRDRDGDGKADERRIVLSGFGTEDTHHILHTLRWGHDGQLYFNQSIYIHSHLETPHGVVRLNSGGVFHLRPPSMELGVFLRGFCNPWGHAIDRFGQSFETDGAGSQGVSYGLPGAMYFTYAGMRRELQSISPGSYPKFCGLEIVYSQHFPEDWQGNQITCDFRAHRVVRFEVIEQGSAYVTRQMPDLIRSTNVTFRPIDVKLGPDGALYIADWSNPIIQHGEVDFRDPRRDHEHGRIWRVTAKGRPLLPKPDLVGASDERLLDELLSPNGYNRQRARRVLTERGAKIVPALERWTEAHRAEPARLEALWIYQAIDQPRADLVEALVKAEDPRIRAAATRVVRFWHSRLNRPLDLLAPLVKDEHPRVRIEALRALSQIPTTQSAALVLESLDRPADPFLDYAIWLSVNDLARPWIDLVQSGEWKIEGQEKKLEFALKAVEPSLATPVVSRWFEKNSLPRDGQGSMIEIAGEAGTAEVLTRVFQQIVRGELEPPAAARALKALGDAARLRKVRPQADLEAIYPLVERGDRAVRREAIRLAGFWKLAAVPKLLAVMKEESDQTGLVQAAIESLRQIGGTDAISGLEQFLRGNPAPPLRRSTVMALAALDAEKAVGPALQMIEASKADSEALEIWRALLSSKGGAAVVARALPASGFPERAGKTGLRVAREGGRNEPELVLALIRSAQLDDQNQTLTADELLRLVATVRKEGDPAKGELIYRRKELACLTCHAIGGAGGKVGPDLTSIGASAPVDYLIESLISPNKKIKEGFEAMTIQTRDGEEFSGILVRETEREVIIRDAANLEKSIVKNNIQRRGSAGSLMPSGLINNLTAGERVDLFRFLAELGKPGPFDASKGNVARSWRVLTDRKGQRPTEGTNVLYTLVDGRLPRNELQAELERKPGSFLATRFQAPNRGRFRFILHPAETGLWIDDKAVNAKHGGEVQLTEGVHQIVLKLNEKTLPEYFRLESNDGVYLAN